MTEQFQTLLENITTDLQETKKLADGDYNPAHAFMWKSALNEGEKVIRKRFESVLAQPALSQQWSPIESAPPTDYNNRILLRCVSKSGSFGRPVIIDGYLEKSAGREHWETGFSYKLTPTHWMPLPTAPKQEG